MADDLIAEVRELRKCKIEGCSNRPPKRGRICDIHAWRHKKYGSYYWTPPPKQSELICAAPDCGKPCAWGGLCEQHYYLKRRYGDFNPRRKSPGLIAAFLEQHVNHGSDECLIWPWEESRIDQGYARASFRGQVMGAHRAMCIMAHGDPPFPKAEAAHSCGNGHMACVNPRHLRWATRAENMADVKLHGRRKRANST